MVYMSFQAVFEIWQIFHTFQFGLPIFQGFGNTRVWWHMCEDSLTVTLGHANSEVALISYPQETLPGHPIGAPFKMSVTGMPWVGGGWHEPHKLQTSAPWTLTQIPLSCCLDWDLSLPAAGRPDLWFHPEPLTPSLPRMSPSQ